jgi:hypothetical protein
MKASLRDLVDAARAILSATADPFTGRKLNWPEGRCVRCSHYHSPKANFIRARVCTVPSNVESHSECGCSRFVPTFAGPLGLRFTLDRQRKLK